MRRTVRIDSTGHILWYPTWSNCLFWAIAHWARYGGYVGMRQSNEVSWLPHFIWSPDLKEWWTYTPTDPRIGWWNLVFKGWVHRANT